jgi:4-hydroxy-tetrahydrodipicolinate synthase
VRPPLTTFAELGEEGLSRVEQITAVMKELDVLMDQLEGESADAQHADSELARA